MKKRAKRGGVGAKRAAPKPRNPFALAARRRRAAVEASPRAYRRRQKHPTATEPESEE